LPDLWQEAKASGGELIRNLIFILAAITAGLTLAGCAVPIKGGFSDVEKSQRTD
jgi:hypothetical protein